MPTDNQRKSSLSGHIKIFLVVSMTLLLPLSIIILSYLGLYDGKELAMYVTAIAVVLATAYLSLGTVVMAIQDSKDKQDSGE